MMANCSGQLNDVIYRTMDLHVGHERHGLDEAPTRAISEKEEKNKAEAKAQAQAQKNDLLREDEVRVHVDGSET
jgi:hypothetical protein